jgi:hypothetical protein
VAIEAVAALFEEHRPGELSFTPMAIASISGEIKAR